MKKVQVIVCFEIFILLMRNKWHFTVSRAPQIWCSTEPISAISGNCENKVIIHILLCMLYGQTGKFSCRKILIELYIYGTTCRLMHIFSNIWIFHEHMDKRKRVFPDVWLSADLFIYTDMCLWSFTCNVTILHVRVNVCILYARNRIVYFRHSVCMRPFSNNTRIYDAHFLSRSLPHSLENTHTNKLQWIFRSIALHLQCLCVCAHENKFVSAK